MTDDHVPTREIVDPKVASLVAFLWARYDETEGKIPLIVPGGDLRDQLLADVAAKRRLIAGHGPGRVVDESDGRWASDPDSWDPPWTKCTGHEWEEYPCELLRLLALPFAGHPDYREEWTP